MSAIKRRGTLLLLVVLPDGSRSLIPASWTDWAGTGEAICRRSLNITTPASHRWRICSTQEGSWTLSLVAA